MNSIPQTQNQDAQLKILRARARTYAIATRLLIAQLSMSMALPICGAILVVFRPEFRASIAAVSLAVIVLDTLLLDRSLKRHVRTGAILGEQFDVAVLELPWEEFSVGDRVDAEDIHAAAKAFSSRHDDAKLRDWYPVAVGRVPLHVARLICQRTNLRYDSRLRRTYGAMLLFTSILLALLLVTSGLVQSKAFPDWVLTMAPATPFWAWAAREYYRQVDTADALDGLKRQDKTLLSHALAGACVPDECTARSREFQNAIYLRRAMSPLVIPLLYRFKRASLEDEMNEGAEHWVREYERYSRAARETK